MTQEWTEAERMLRFRRPYRQPTVHDTPHEENADNVRYAIHHLAKPALLHRYEIPAEHNPTTGRLDRGPHTEIEIWLEIQPPEGEGTQPLPEGEHVEGMMAFWLDPHHPQHIRHHNRPIYLRQSDSRFVTGDGFAADTNGGHADIIVWMGERYIVRRVKNWASSSHEDGNGQFTGVQSGLLKLWRDHYHERERNRDNDQFAYP